MYTERLLLAHIRILGVGFSSIHLCTRYGYTQRREGLLLLSHAHFLVYYIYSPFNIQAIMSNEEESLLALLCESLSNGQRGNAPIFINFNSFNGPVGQHNDHADTVNFSMDKDGAISFQHVRRTGKSIIQPEVMAKALERTMEEGYWWASTAWAVVYRIYQMKGYAGSVSQFVREVEEWPWQKKPEYECNYDAVCKPIRSGKLAGTPDGWVKNGASSQYAILGQKLLNEFQKLELQFQK